MPYTRSTSSTPTRLDHTPVPLRFLVRKPISHHHTSIPGQCEMLHNNSAILQTLNRMSQANQLRSG